MTIKALRLLPPLAFARFGSASEPQDNYELAEDSSLEFRRIRPTDTLIVAADGTLTIRNSELSTRPAQHSAKELAVTNAMFRDGDRMRPVAPFFEVWALTDKRRELVPLTMRLLADHEKLDGSAIQWKVHVENRKVFRRTGDTDDIVKAKIDWFGGHKSKQLHGTCPNFIEGAAIEFGQVQPVKPNDSSETSSHIRLRFTPAQGKIYGPVRRRDDVPDDSHDVPDDSRYVKPIYKEGGKEEGKKRGKKKGKETATWPRFSHKNPNQPKADGDDTWPRETLPASLYANTNPAPAAPWLNQDRAESRGYLDDACDGFISVRIKGRDELEAKARICVAPPAFTPDSQFVRSLADDLDQALCGPVADDIYLEEARRRALDIVRRAYETVRFMNVAVANGNSVDGRPAAAFDTMPAEEAFATERPVRPVMAPANADTAAVLALHQQVFAALRSGAAPWFVSLLRKPEDAGDLTDKGRRKMPALMSGADSYYLALTRRQLATIEKVAKGEALSPRNRTAQALISQLHHRAAGNPITSRPEMAIANCCPGLEVDFRAVWRRLFVGIVLSEWENCVVETEAALDERGNKVDLKALKGHRLLRVGTWKGKKFEGSRVAFALEGPSPSDPEGKVTVRSSRNPNGAWTMEWSNCFADVVRKVQKGEQEWFDCEFTAEAEEFPQPAKEEPEPPVKKPKRSGNKLQPAEPQPKWVRLRARKFFESDTAVISEKLAQPGELTQGLCSPWQNDLRECSCFYWAGSRPDFVNTKIGKDGLTHGDFWFARKRTGEYVPDDYADGRLMTYDELFESWEKLLQFQIGGEDSTQDLFDSPKDENSRRDT